MGGLHLYRRQGSWRYTVTDCSSGNRPVSETVGVLEFIDQHRFAFHLYRSRSEYRLVCQRADKGGKPIERCVISTFEIAASMASKASLFRFDE